MKRELVVTLILGLSACGGSKPATSTPVAGTGGDTAAPVSDTPAPADTGTATASDDKASTDEAGPKKNDAGEFKVNEADKTTRPKQGTLQATATEAAVRFFVVDKKNGPYKGIVISLTGPDGRKYYTEATNDDGFAEVLVPIGKTYDLVYVSLGRTKGVAAKVKVANKPNLNLKLTLRYKREVIPTAGKPAEPHKFVLTGVQFKTGKATLTPDSHIRLDTIVEYMLHKKSARIEISGHTDNVGSKAANKKLSQARADAVRDYLVSQGIDAGRITAIGYGDEKPIASNKTREGRQKNRRIEAKEL